MKTGVDFLQIIALIHLITNYIMLYDLAHIMLFIYQDKLYKLFPSIIKLPVLTNITYSQIIVLIKEQIDMLLYIASFALMQICFDLALLKTTLQDPSDNIHYLIILTCINLYLNTVIINTITKVLLSIYYENISNYIKNYPNLFKIIISKLLTNKQNVKSHLMAINLNIICQLVIYIYTLHFL